MPQLPPSLPHLHCLCAAPAVEIPSSPGRSGSSSTLLPGGLLQCLYVRVLVDLGRTQWVSSVDGGGWRGADIGLVGKLGRILTGVNGGRGQDPGPHAHRDLVDDAGRIGSVLHGVAC